jgi:hypothetical protein
MKRGLSGHHEGIAAFGAQVRAFVPHLLLYEMGGVPGALTEGAVEVSCYAAAMEKVLRLHEHLQRRPITSAAQTAGAIQASIPTATSALRKLESLGMIRELTGGAYRRLYGYSAYLEILNEGTDPIVA